MKLYTIYFRVTDKDYNPERKYATKKVKHGPDPKVYLNVDGGLTVLEDEIKKYWEYGGGVERLVFMGELPDERLNPTLAEPDFVDEQIKSKKNGETIGYQG